MLEPLKEIMSNKGEDDSHNEHNKSTPGEKIKFVCSIQVINKKYSESKYRDQLFLEGEDSRVCGLTDSLQRGGRTGSGQHEDRGLTAVLLWILVLRSMESANTSP